METTEQDARDRRRAGRMVRAARPRLRVGMAGLGVLAVMLAVGCSSAEDATSEAGPTTSVTAPPTTAPVDFRSAMVSRLSDEWGDAAVAEEVVAAIGAEGLASWEAELSLDEVATTPLLDYVTPTTPADDIDSVVVFAFGNRLAADGTPEPGPTNEALAEVTAAFVADHPVPVYAQWEVARSLVADGVPDVFSIEPTTGADGTVVYLSTRGVADAAVAEATASGVAMGTVGVICFADHEGRCLRTADAAGMDATAIEGVELPSTYDPESGQPWTRERVAYLTTDLMARLVS